jgi:hypothetical protein
MRKSRLGIGLHLAPLAGRGRIASAIRVRGSFRERSRNRFENARQVALHVIVPKSQDTEVAVHEPFVTNGVAMAIRMLSAIHFHSQPAFAAYKIYSVRPDRLLPDKFKSIQPARSQTIPEHAFCVRWYTSQTPGAFRPEFVSTAHAETPPHPPRFARRPLPASGERRKYST